MIRASSDGASELHRGKTLWTLIARFTDEMWMVQQAKRATENSIQMISAPYLCEHFQVY